MKKLAKWIFQFKLLKLNAIRRKEISYHAKIEYKNYKKTLKNWITKFQQEGQLKDNFKMQSWKMVNQKKDNDHNNNLCISKDKRN